MGLDTKTYWLTDRQSQCDFDFNFNFNSSVQFSIGDDHRKFVEDLWRPNVWIEDFVCYNYSNLETGTSICNYN
jgi:hypothetical protein